MRRYYRNKYNTEYIYDKNRKRGMPSKNNNNIEIIKSMRSNGKTFQEIGNILGISKQRVHQIYQNNNTVLA